MGLNDFLQWRSLRTRVTLLILAVFLAGIWSMAFHASRALRADMQRLLGQQQLAMVSILAAQVDREINDRLRALKAVADGVSPAMLGDPAAMQVLLEQRPVLLALFNGGVITRRAEGMAAEAVAELAENRASIGAPVPGAKANQRVLEMSVPIRDGTGRVVGALGGVTDLGRPNFLGKIIASHDNKGGNIMLVSRQHRQLVIATDPRVTAIPAPGANALIDRFIAGDEGSHVGLNAAGIEVLGSARSVAVANWYLAMAIPTADAFAPIHAMQQHMLLETMVLTLLVGALTWWLLKRELSPLFSTVDTLAKLPARNQPPLALPITGQYEVDQLVAGFNRLLEVLAQREAECHENAQRYRDFFEFSPDAILVHRHDRIVFANAAAARLFRARSAATLVGRDWHELIDGDEWAITEQRIAAIVSGEINQAPPLERRHITLDGQIIVMESLGARIVFDGAPAVLTVIRNITERRQAEERRLVETHRQRDTLVREVHHRIKNNLQSVAGLLQRELGQFVEHNPRLEAAISQVNAIAAVHGLQSANPDEAVDLCDNVCSICKSVADLTLRPVLFHDDRVADGESDGASRLRVANDEAVSMALVVNELVLNAVKHSPPEGPAPSVSFSADADGARLLIRNAVAAPPDFDFASGIGLGTGLRLVRSLLPAHGARLAHELDKDGFMLTRLELTAPIVAAISQPETD